ncbi:acVLRF1 family peptidyl-tRNA hydrolase [Microlunatus sp. Y2014]|uniref:acVLRF1 family peptidyl-tRNA hydrolase n=1 Tax=Microlunatus sp. Y2014 TaxID=3418488 RepID=UPI003DA7872F
MSDRTVLVPRARLARWLDNFALSHGEPRFALADDELSVTAPDGAQALVRIPYGPIHRTGDARADVLDHLAITRRIGVLLARRGGHAVGVFEGDRLVSSKVGGTYVQGRTKAGGWSQQRYARRRDNQARNARDGAVGDAVRILVDEVPGPLDAVECGGDRTMCEEILGDGRLNEVAELWRPKVVHPVPDPRLRVLQGFLEQSAGLRILLNEAATRR